MEDTEKINTLVGKSQRIIMRTSSVFPFEIFPDSIIVDENKLTIVQRIFFSSHFIYTVLIKDILSVSVTTSPFFSTFTLEVTGLETNPNPVHFLKRAEAAKLRRVVMGLISCAKEGIDLSKIPDNEITRKVEDIGKLHIVG
jgi:hypothetical protein